MLIRYTCYLWEIFLSLFPLPKLIKRQKHKKSVMGLFFLCAVFVEANSGKNPL